MEKYIEQFGKIPNLKRVRWGPYIFSIWRNCNFQFGKIPNYISSIWRNTFINLGKYQKCQMRAQKVAPLLEKEQVNKCPAVFFKIYLFCKKRILDIQKNHWLSSSSRVNFCGKAPIKYFIDNFHFSQIQLLLRKAPIKYLIDNLHFSKILLLLRKGPY